MTSLGVPAQEAAWPAECLFNPNAAINYANNFDDLADWVEFADDIVVMEVTGRYRGGPAPARPADDAEPPSYAYAEAEVLQLLHGDQEVGETILLREYEWIGADELVPECTPLRVGTQVLAALSGAGAQDTTLFTADSGLILDGTGGFVVTQRSPATDRLEALPVDGVLQTIEDLSGSDPTGDAGQD